MGKLAGKGAVVIGTTNPGTIGQQIARRFVEEGARVMVAGRKEGPLKAFAQEVGCEWSGCDITKRSDVFALAEAAKARLGRVDIGVNATGHPLIKSLEDTTEEDLRMITDVQFIGPVFFLQAMLSVMEDGGSLIEISTASTEALMENHAAYTGTKAAKDQVIRCVANDYGHRGIRANSISPGLTMTPATAWMGSMPGFIDLFSSCYPLGRLGTIDDIAAAAVWLASDECFMTGQNLQVNGGLTLRRNPNMAEIRGVMPPPGPRPAQ